MTLQLQSAPADLDTAAIERLATLSQTRPVWLRVGRVIDGSSDQPLHDASVIFDAKQIHAITTNGATPSAEFLPAGLREPDANLPEFTLLPCLIEAHAHLFLAGGPVNAEARKRNLTLSSHALIYNARRRLAAILPHGIATIRDAGDKDGVGLALAAEARTLLGKLSDVPWIDSPGAAIHHRGRYGSFMGEPIEDHAGPAECVAARVAAGADRIKLLVSGIIDFRTASVTTKPQMDVPEVAAIAIAARQHRRQTFAHASGAPGIENSIAGGVTTVEHGYFVTYSQLARLRDAEIAWVPTFAPVQAQIDFADEIGWEPAIVDNLRRIIDGHRTMLAAAHEMGVTILAGSDAGSCGVPHGSGLIDEMCHMEQAGLPAMAVLKSATGKSATTLAFAEHVGRIERGYRARFILTRHDPSRTVTELRKDKSIVFDGKYVVGGSTCLEANL